jgi:DNA invertase Pin-like site-specific DNA recombinase
VSKDDDGRERSPDQQHDDHIRDGERHHFDLHPEPYRDIGSASRHGSKARADFDRMMTDLEAGRDQFGADGLAVWEPSRGSRQVWEWARLIDLLAKAKLLVWVHTGSEGGRFYDLNHPRDRKDLQDDAVDAEYESGKTSLRVARDHAARAREGRPAGRLAVGQVAEYHPRTGRLVRRAWDPEESKLVVELFARLAKGDTLSGIERDWRNRGIVNGKGKPYTGQQLRHMARNRSYIAQRVHIVGQLNKRWWQVGAGGYTITPGQWDPLLKTDDGEPDIDLFNRIQELLDAEGRPVTRPGGARHILSVTGRCDPCSAPLTAVKLRGEPMYRCKFRGCVAVPEADLDAFVTAAMKAFLADPKQYRQLDHGEHTAAELRAARTERDRIQAHYNDMKAETKAFRMSPAAFAEMEPDVLAALEEAKATVRRLERPTRLKGLIEPGPDVAERWPTDIVIQRKIAAALLQRDAVGELRILRSPRRGKVRAPIDERVVFDRE